MPPTGSYAAGLSEAWPCPGGRSTAAKSASRGRRLTGKFVTESNLSLRGPAQRAADLVDWVPGLIEAGAVPDLDVLRACEARRAGQMISLSGAARPGADGQDLPHMRCRYPAEWFARHPRH
jgi:hypothetical protein